MKLTGDSIQEREPVDESPHNKDVPQISVDSSEEEETPAAVNTNHILNNDVLVPTVKENVHVEFVEPQTFKGIQRPSFGGRNILDIDGEKQKGIEYKLSIKFD